MKIEQAITILKKYNKWRRGTPPYDEVGNRQPYSAKDIGLAIDCVVEHFEGISGNQREIPSNPQSMSNDRAINILTHWADGFWMEEHNITNGDFDIAVSLACKALNPSKTCNSDKNLQGLVWHKASEELPTGDSPVLIAWKNNSGRLAMEVIFPPETLTCDDMDWWMEIPELPKED